MIRSFKKYFSQKKRIKEYNKNRPHNKRDAFCWAPFTALRFHRNGSVQVCCHHIDYFSLSENPLQNVWLGSELENMRNQMKQYDIPPSCNFCASEYYSNNFSNVIAKSYDYYSINENKYPAFIDFSLSNRCNLACAMCDSSLSSKVGERRGHKTNFDFKYDNDFLKQLEPFLRNLKSSVFTGGEPFMIDIYYQIWETMTQINPQAQIFVTTNGTVLNDRVKDIIQKGNFNFNISIDSFNKDNYEKIRIGANYEQVMQNLDYYASYCKEKKRELTITICPMQTNWKDIPEIVQRCNDNNWGFSFNNLIKPWNLALWSLPNVEIVKILSFYKQQKFAENGSKSQRNIQTFNALIDLLQMWAKVAEYLAEIQIDEKSATESFVNSLSLLINAPSDDGFYSERIKSIAQFVPVSLMSFIDFANNSHYQKLLKEEIELYDDETVAEHLSLMLFHKAVVATFA